MISRREFLSASSMAVASEQKVFRPVERDTGDKAATAFARKSARGYYLAVFNHEFEKPQTVGVPLRRIARRLAAGKVRLRDVAAGEEMSAAHGAVTVTLTGAESKLLELMV